jgi:hypothetical protein
LAELLFLAAAVWGAGHVALWRRAITWDSPYEEIGIKLGLGFAVLSMAALGLGLAGALYPAALLTLLAIFAMIAIPGIYYSIHYWRQSPGAKMPPLNIGLIGLLVVAILAILPFLLAPETFYDALVYHLGLPNTYLLHHRIFPTPTNVYSGIPANAQMIYLFAMALGGAPLAKLANCMWGLAIPLFYFGLASRWKSYGAGLLATAFFLATPIALYECYRTSVGLCWSFFQMAAIYAFLVALREPPDAASRITWWGLSGIFCGLAMGTKYPAWGLPLALLVALLFARFRLESEHRARGREIFFAVGMAALALSPWLVKNFVFYRNPVFPYFYEKFESDQTGQDDWLKERWQRTAQKKIDWEALNIDARARPSSDSRIARGVGNTSTSSRSAISISASAATVAASATT